MKLGDDITQPRWLIIKAVLFIVAGSMAGILLWLQNPDWRTALLLAIAIWAFARVYYFVFYVITHYIDVDYRFSGIVSFLQWLWRQRRGLRK